MARKTVRALKTGFYEGHRRREGAIFTVPAGAKEDWFVEIGPAAEDDTAPAQLLEVRSPPPTTFVGVMDRIAQQERAKEQELSKPLSEVEAPPPLSPAGDGDLI